MSENTLGGELVPVYDYECGICQFRFERKQGFDEEPVAMCPKCQGKVRRVLHSIPIIYKGSGFYSTDNRKGNHTEEGEKEKPDKENQKEK